MNIDFESIGFAVLAASLLWSLANLLVLVTIDELMNDNTKPKSWEDLLKDEYRNKLL